MPTYNVRLTVNVPGLGDRNVVQIGVTAANPCVAIDVAKANIIITALSVEQIAP